MSTETIMVMVISVIAIFSLCCLLSVAVYDRKIKSSEMSSAKKDDWLFAGFNEALFKACYKKPAEEYCGIKTKEFERYTKIIHFDAKLEEYAGMRLAGAGTLLICLILAALCSTQPVMAAVFAVIGFAVFALLWIVPYAKLKDAAQERLFRIRDDLPRFLSLLDKAMSLPIDQAMLLTASKFDSPLSDDIINSINKVSLGADGWQTTLFDLAKTYDMPDFSDLVLEIINSYERGIDVTQLINRKNYEIEQNRMYDVEAHDSKIKTTIFLPIIALKVLPLMVLVALPMISDFV